MTSAARTTAAPWLPAQVRDLGRPAGRRRVRDDAAARELDHPVRDPGDLAVVGDDQDRGLLACVCSCSSSRIWTPVRKSSSPVGSSASRIGFPSPARALSRRAAVRRPRARGGSGRSRSPSPTRSSIAAATSRASSRPLVVGRELHVLERREAGEEVEVWKTKETLWRRKRKSSLREAPVMSFPATTTDPRWASRGRRSCSAAWFCRCPRARGRRRTRRGPRTGSRPRAR